MNNSEFVQWLRGAAPYINTHRGRTFVLALGGDALAHANFVPITHDIALLTSLGVRLVLVHGARQQIEAALAAAGSPPRYQQHLRVTDEGAMTIVKGVVGALEIQIEARLSTGMPGTPMHNARVRVVSGNFVAARPMGSHSRGPQRVASGRRRRIRPSTSTCVIWSSAPACPGKRRARRSVLPPPRPRPMRMRPISMAPACGASRRSGSGTSWCGARTAFRSWQIACAVGVAA